MFIFLCLLLVIGFLFYNFEFLVFSVFVTCVFVSIFSCVLLCSILILLVSVCTLFPELWVEFLVPVFLLVVFTYEFLVISCFIL